MGDSSAIAGIQSRRDFLNAAPGLQSGAPRCREPLGLAEHCWHEPVGPETRPYPDWPPPDVGKPMVWRNIAGGSRSGQRPAPARTGCNRSICRNITGATQSNQRPAPTQTSPAQPRQDPAPAERGPIREKPSLPGPAGRSSPSFARWSPRCRSAAPPSAAGPSPAARGRSPRRHRPRPAADTRCWQRPNWGKPAR